MKHIPERIIPAQELKQCVVCGRYFTAERIRAHEAICEVSSGITRKCFDISEQLLRGADTEPLTHEDEGDDDECEKYKRSGLNTNWRGKHEEFLQKIREAKQQGAEKSMSNLPEASLLDNDLDCVQCQYCLRQYTKLSASRHISICAWRSAKANM